MGSVLKSIENEVRTYDQKKHGDKDNDVDNVNTTQEKEQSMTKIIPMDLLCGRILPCLMIRSIISVARVDRKMAIACHTPLSISNLTTRHHHYPHSLRCIGGDNGNYRWQTMNRHRMQCVTQLTLSVQAPSIVYNKYELTKVVKLAVYRDSALEDDDGWESNSVDRSLRYKFGRGLPALRELSLVGLGGCMRMWALLHNFAPIYEDKKKTLSFGPGIHLLESIAVIACVFKDRGDLERCGGSSIVFKMMLELFMPSAGQKLRELKIVGSTWNSVEDWYLFISYK